MKNKRLLTVFVFTLLFVNLSLAQKDQETIDTRIDNMGYWQKMAEKGLVPVAPSIPIKPAVYKNSKINSKSVKTKEFDDILVTDLDNVTQSENSVFVKPTDNGDYILNSNNSTSWTGSGGYVDILYGANYFYSNDGGSNWEGSISGAGENNYGDPSTAINHVSGRLYVGFINGQSGQSVSYSNNNGTDWTTIEVESSVGFNLLDKPHMWINNSSSSPYSGYLYYAWTFFDYSNTSSFNNQIGIVRSIDNGLSWTNLTNISSNVNAGSHNQGVNIQTGPNGEVYAVWAIYDVWGFNGGVEEALGFAKSLDGGETWELEERIINNIRGIRADGTPGGKDHRVNSFPVMAVDISSGNIYVVWANRGVPGTNSGSNISVYMIKSTDKGDNWSAPTRVNKGPFLEDYEAYFPWITCDPVNGNLSVIFYDDRDTHQNQSPPGPPSVACEVFVAISDDAGDNWIDFVVSDVEFTPSPIPGLAVNYMGDYLGITAYNNQVYPCWTDNRDGYFRSYVSPFDFELKMIIPPVNPQVFLNYNSGLVNLSWDPIDITFLHYRVYRNGDFLATTTNTSYEDQLPAYGIYNYDITAVYEEGESDPVSIEVQWGDATISVNQTSLNAGLPPEDQTTIPLNISNTGVLDLDFDVSTAISSKGSKEDYCPSVGGGGDEFIQNVSIGAINNTTGQNYYADYTAISTIVNIGESYPITITNGDPIWDVDQCGIWVDWNQNEDFYDDEPIVVSGTPGVGPYTANIIPPADALSGSARMRVQIIYGTTPDPCLASFQYGEVEDYSLNIINWLSINPSAGTITPGNSQQIDVTFDAGGLSAGVYTADISISSNDPDYPLINIPCTLDVVEGIIVRLTAFLEGPFLFSEMNPWLNSFGSIPLEQPYNTDPWNYNGGESVGSLPSSDIIDWVLVELRETSGDASEATPETVVANQAGFILNDGTLCNTSGTSPMFFDLQVNDNLYAVVWHRNHLGIMSANALMAGGSTFTYNFTDDESKVYGGRLGHKEISPGIWGMMSGDGDANGEIQNQDKADVYEVEKDSSGYFNGDYNMNHNVDDVDKTLFWEPNAGQGSRVVENSPN